MSELRAAWDRATVDERRELVALVLALPLDGPEWVELPIVESYGLPTLGYILGTAVHDAAPTVTVAPDAPHPFAGQTLDVVPGTRIVLPPDVVAVREVIIDLGDGTRVAQSRGERGT